MEPNRVAVRKLGLEEGKHSKQLAGPMYLPPTMLSHKEGPVKGKHNRCLAASLVLVYTGAETALATSFVLSVTETDVGHEKNEGGA